MKRLALWLGVDRAIFFTLLSRGWNVAAGLLTIVFVTHFLSPEVQGYYYTFFSLIALQVFAEMGLNLAIVQFASHEMAKLSWTEEETLSGSPEAKQRIRSLFNFIASWFGVVSLLMIAVLLPVGSYFFGLASTTGSPVLDVDAPWTLLVIFTAFNMLIAAVAALLEGCGKIVQVAMMRSVQVVFASAAVWIVLSLGGNLYALAASSLMTALVGSVWLWRRYRVFLKDLLRHRTPQQGMSWRHEIWPFQWRVATSAMSAYFILQLFTPLIFATHGPVMAGQMGMSMQIIAAINGIALAWITTKAPIFGQLVASKQTKALDLLFFRALTQSFGLLVGTVICVCLGLFYLSELGSPYAMRVLPLSLFVFLCIICLARHVVFAEASYMRAYKQEPFMVLSVVSAFVTAILAWVFIPPFGAAGAVYSYTFTCLTISLGMGSVIFFRKRAEWSRAGLAPMSDKSV